jgi:hypothetical protein
VASERAIERDGSMNIWMDVPSIVIPELMVAETFKEPGLSGSHVFLHIHDPKKERNIVYCNCRRMVVHQYPSS